MEPIDQREVIVIGAGISGLVTAWRLLNSGIDVAVLEAADGVGGCMRSERRDGFILEKGPFNVLVRDEAFKTLLDECADDVAPIKAAPEANRRYLLRHEELQEVPMGPGGLMRTKLLSTRAKLRLLRGMLLSARSHASDPTIAETAERRLGPEVAETFISSIVAGVFGGDSRRLSLKACFPRAWRFDQERLCPLAYEVAVMRRKRKEAARNPDHDRYKGLISFADGLQTLPDGLARRLGSRLTTGCRVESIERDENGYRLRLRSGDGTRTMSCRRLVLATPSSEAARLLRPLVPEVSRELDGIESASLVVLNLGYRRQDVAHPMVGYGFLVPASETSVPVMGALWADSAFPHHADGDRRVIRVFMGGPRDPGAAERPDAELLATANRTLRNLLGIGADPVLIDVCRWPTSIPQYRPGHTEHIDRVCLALNDAPGLHLAGNYLRGVSINDCVREGILTADDVMLQLKRTERDDRSKPSSKRPVLAGGRRDARGAGAHDRASSCA
ncbi:MAG: protoporphyrinogen oxidase [Planctomycetota bacterium]|jgi:oxygen-dependent protoporphyrinogen oxidase